MRVKNMLLSCVLPLREANMACLARCRQDGSQKLSGALSLFVQGQLAILDACIGHSKKL